MHAPLKIIVHGLQTILTDSIFAIRGLSNHPSFLPILENFSLSEILWTEFIFSDPFLQINSFRSSTSWIGSQITALKLIYWTRFLSTQSWLAIFLSINQLESNNPGFKKFPMEPGMSLLTTNMADFSVWMSFFQFHCDLCCYGWTWL